MRQGDGADLLGPNDPRSASIGVIYVAPSDDRQTVLTAILTQDKLGRKQVVVVLPEQNKAFLRPVDFDGLKNMRRGLKAQIAFVAPSGPGPAEFARQRRFPVYSSLESLSQSLKAATTVGGTSGGPAKRGIFGFGRKQEAAAVAGALVSSSRVEQEPLPPLHAHEAVDIPEQDSAPILPGSGADPDLADESNGSSGWNAAVPGIAGLAAGTGFTALANDHNASSTLENSEVDWGRRSPTDAGSYIDSDTLSNDTPLQDSEEHRTPAFNGVQDRTDPGPEIITFSTAASRPKLLANFLCHPQ